MRNLFAGLICALMLLAGCGGGGDSAVVSGGTSGTGGTGTGGTGTGGTGGGTSSTAYNVVNAVVDSGPSALLQSGSAAVNLMYVKVTVCVPGSTTNCQTIDHIQVDTGSQGLRLISSAVSTSLLNALSPVMASGSVVAECTQFVDGYSWGPLYSADVHIGGADSATSGEVAPGIPVQIIGTSAYAVPNGCASAGGVAENTVADFGANGIIGLGLFDYDCGTGCSSAMSYASIGWYYTCSSASSCVLAPVPESSQAVNPVFMLAAQNGVTDNNGVSIVLPSIPANGQASVNGTLVFGISTQANNTLATSATVLNTDAYYGFVNTTLSGVPYSTSYLDSGSNALYFDDGNIPNCTQSSAQGFMCPASTESFTATILANSGNQQANVSFTIGNAVTLFTTNNSFAAFDDIGGTAGTSGSGSTTFAWGLPFYYGRTVYTAMEKVNAGGTNGPYFAF